MPYCGGSSNYALNAFTQFGSGGYFADKWKIYDIFFINAITFRANVFEKKERHFEITNGRMKA